MLHRTLVSILFGLAVGLAMREPSRRQSGGTAAAPGGPPETVRRIDGLEDAVADLRRGLEQLGAEQSRASGSLREWVEERLAAMDNRLVQGEAGQAGARKLDDRLQQHAEAIQQLEDRLVHLERSNRELGLRLERLQSPALAAKALRA
jgi:chromosome segregation ATPase